MAKGELILSKVTIMHLVVKFLVSIHASWKWWNLFICTIFIKTRLFCIFCIILSCHIFHYCCKSPYFTYHYSQKYKIKLSFSSNYPALHAAFYKCYTAFSQCVCNITQLLYGSVSQGLGTTKFTNLIGWNGYWLRSRFSHLERHLDR